MEEAAVSKGRGGGGFAPLRRELAPDAPPSNPCPPCPAPPAPLHAAYHRVACVGR